AHPAAPGRVHCVRGFAGVSGHERPRPGVHAVGDDDDVEFGALRIACRATGPGDGHGLFVIDQSLHGRCECHWGLGTGEHGQQLGPGDPAVVAVFGQQLAEVILPEHAAGVCMGDVSLDADAGLEVALPCPECVDDRVDHGHEGEHVPGPVVPDHAL